MQLLVTAVQHTSCQAIIKRMSAGATTTSAARCSGSASTLLLALRHSRRLWPAAIAYASVCSLRVDDLSTTFACNAAADAVGDRIK
jgi:hypothetical protein